jgi:flavin reductase (DIM6/NTAB) family NADH-FMN oxidoreductase RutF
VTDHDDAAYHHVLPADAPGGVYHFLTGVVAPRPIAWVSSVGPDGVLNVAPHSYFQVLAHNPLTLGVVSVGEKDTLRNIRVAGEYVINIASDDLVERMNLTAANFPPEEDEFAWAGLTPVPSQTVAVPAVREAPVSLEMRLTEIKPIGDCFLIIGEVRHVRYAAAIVVDGRVDPARLRLVARMAGSTYARTTDRFNLKRPTYRSLLDANVQPVRPSQG